MKTGNSKLRRVHSQGRSHAGPVLITGGAGFVGTNLAAHLLRSGRPVHILDNLSRPGVERNVRWLNRTFGELLTVQVDDIRDRHAVQRAIRNVTQVFHFAAQVAVTTSLVDPVLDFDINLLGTLNLLEGLRSLDSPPPLVFTSTNKVYGGLNDLSTESLGTRHVFRDPDIGAYGVDETRPLDFHSPYGCSKGAADQYILDYTRTFGIKAVVFRMSCIYGPHQFGTEDQGWVAHFLIRALAGDEIVLFGDGKQVRDILFVEDLVRAFMLAQDNMDQISGLAFNIGGGPANTISLLELIQLIGEKTGSMPSVRFEDWRPGDQRVYVSDSRKFQSLTGWLPKVTVRQGVKQLHNWLTKNNEAESPPHIAAAAENV